MRSECTYSLALVALAALMLGIASARAAAVEGNSVGGTGHIVPRGGIIRIGGLPGYEIDKIFVHVGQTLKRGDPLFEEDCYQAREGAKFSAIALKAVKTDSDYRKKIEAERLSLAHARLLSAQRTLANYRAVGASGTSKLKLAQLHQDVAEAAGNLKIEQLTSAQLDFDVETQIRRAAQRARTDTANLGRCSPRAPTDGTVLAIERHVGEYVGGDPVIRFGDLSAMYVDGQFFQGDMRKIRVGMKVEVKNAAFPHLADGKVVEVGSLIGTESQLGNVKIRLDRADPADHFVGMEVDVVIPR